MTRHGFTILSSSSSYVVTRSMGELNLNSRGAAGSCSWFHVKACAHPTDGDACRPWLVVAGRWEHWLEEVGWRFCL